MQRKVIELGKNSLVISLPSSFVKENNISKGDEINVEPLDDSSLSIYTKKKEVSRKAQIQSSGKFMKRLVHRNYVAGYDEITIKYTEPVFDRVEEAVEELIGFEIVSMSDSQCVIRSISKALDSEFDSMLRRLFVLILTTVEDTIRIIESREYEKLKIHSKFKTQTDRYSLFCERLLNRGIISQKHESSKLYCIVWSLEQIADEFGYIWSIINDHDEEFMQYYKETTACLRLFYEIFYQNDSDKILELKKRLETLFGKYRSTPLTAFLQSIQNKVFHLSLFILPGQQINYQEK